MTTYIHGTNSATLIALRHSDFTLCNLNTMLFKYGYAPMAGEIFCGGVIGILDDVDTAFGDLDDKYNYSLKRIIESYACFEWRPYLDDKVKLANRLRKFLDSNMVYSIRILIVDLLRHKQVASLADIAEETKAELSTFITAKQDETTKRFTANYAAARFMVVTPGRKTNTERLEIDTFFTELWQELPVNFLDLPINTQKDICAKIVEIKGASPFVEINIRSNTSKKDVNKNVDYQLSTALIYPDRNDFISIVTSVETRKNGGIAAELNFDLIKDRIQDTITRLNAAADLLKNIINGQQKAHEFALSEPWVRESFPVIILCTDSALMERVKSEYRATQALKFGSDIKMIAVPEEKVSEVREYFTRYGISITVITISELSAENAQTLAHVEPAPLVVAVTDTSQSKSVPIITAYQDTAEKAAPLPKAVVGEQLETEAIKKVSGLKKIFGIS